MSKAAVIALDDIQKKQMCSALEQAGIDAVVFPSYGSAFKTVNEEIKIFIIEANCYDMGAIEFIEAAAHVSAVIVVAEGMGASVLEKQLEDSGVIVLEAPVSRRCTADDQDCGHTAFAAGTARKGKRACGKSWTT